MRRIVDARPARPGESEVVASKVIVPEGTPPEQARRRAIELLCAELYRRDREYAALWQTGDYDGGEG